MVPKAGGLMPIRSKAGLSAFVIPSEREGSRGWVSPESKPRSFGHDTGLRMTNKGKPEIPRSLRSFGTTNINGLFGTTTKALSS